MVSSAYAQRTGWLRPCPDAARLQSFKVLELGPAVNLDAAFAAFSAKRPLIELLAEALGSGGGGGRGGGGGGRGGGGGGRLSRQDAVQALSAARPGQLQAAVAGLRGFKAGGTCEQ
jgi:hypothetical protein